MNYTNSVIDANKKNKVVRHRKFLLGKGKTCFFIIINNIIFINMIKKHTFSTTGRTYAIPA